MVGRSVLLAKIEPDKVQITVLSEEEWAVLRRAGEEIQRGLLRQGRRMGTMCAESDRRRDKR